jgi:serine/threonine protein kinase
MLPTASPEAIDLLTQMLSLDPSKRPSAGQALQHPFFRGEKCSVSKPGPGIERSPIDGVPRPIAPGPMMKDDEVERVQVRSVEQPLRLAARPSPARQLSMPASLADPEIDDIFADHVMPTV